MSHALCPSCPGIQAWGSAPQHQSSRSSAAHARPRGSRQSTRSRPAPQLSRARTCPSLLGALALGSERWMHWNPRGLLWGAVNSGDREGVPAEQGASRPASLPGRDPGGRGDLPSSSWKLGMPGLEKTGHPSCWLQGWSRGQGPVPGPWMCGQHLPPTGLCIPLPASVGCPWQGQGVGGRAAASSGARGRLADQPRHGGSAPDWRKSASSRMWTCPRREAGQSAHHLYEGGCGPEPA